MDFEINDITYANNDNLFIESDLESNSDQDNDNGNDTGISSEDEYEINYADEAETGSVDLQNIHNSYLFYNQTQEMQIEIDNYNYHLNKNTGDWLLAKNIVALSESKPNTEYFWDQLDLLFKVNNDNFDNIIKIIYSSDNTLIEFDTKISKYVVDNLKICKYKPNGYLFNNNNDTNIWAFKIVVVTSKNIYSANRYIDEHKIGCF